MVKQHLKTEDEAWEEAEDGSRDGKRLNRQGRRLIRQFRAETFRCVHCGADVPLAAAGSQHRNHCPLCLWSRHVDEAVGDRRAGCLAGMQPLGLAFRDEFDDELVIVHRCTGCGKIARNRLAGDDNPVAVEGLLTPVELLPGISWCTDSSLVHQALWGK